MAALIVEGKERIQDIRTALENLGYYDASRRIIKLKNQETFIDGRIVDTFALPITDLCCGRFLSPEGNQRSLPQPFENCKVCNCNTHLEKSSQAKPCDVLHSCLLQYFSELFDEVQASEMMKCVPKVWKRHGDMVLFPSDSFSNELWSSYLDSLSKSLTSKFWSMVSNSLKCSRLALCNKVVDDDFRSSGVTLLYGSDGWVDHVDNGIHYIFDVTKCMFSFGNISEKLRIASFDCSGETIVDLYAGIGYFVLPFAVHAKASLVHACEWNPHAVEALRRGLKANRVEEKCVVHMGDNKKADLCNVADRVNLGLIPSSEEGWPVACKALKSCTGGWLYIHGTVCTKSSDNSDDLERIGKYLHLFSSKSLECIQVVDWIDYVSHRVLQLLEDSTRSHWSVQVRHVEHVKMYAPHISHIVLDVECRPS